MALNLSRLTFDYIRERAEMLRTSVGNRNAKMDRFEKLYRMDVWPDAMKPTELRVTIPTGFDVVEKMRGLLITRRPQVSVPYPSANMADQVKAQKKERYLYGVMHRTNFLRLLADAEWYAMCLGQGVLKASWYPHAAEDEFPILVSAPDPRTLYGRRSPQKDRYVELAHWWTRPRRDIRDEWGDAFKAVPPDSDFKKQAAWWDEQVDYIEYWVEQYDWEDIEPEPEPPKMLADLVGEALLTQVAAPIVDAVDAEVAAEAAATEAAEAEVPQQRRVRKIVHAVIVLDRPADGVPKRSRDEFGKGWTIKKAVVVPGYHIIPYVAWAGVSTPLAGENESLSILYPLTNGDGGQKAMGVVAAMSILASIDLTTAVMSPNSPLFVDDQNAEIDTEPNAVNRVSPGTRSWRTPPDATNPAVVRMFEQLQGVLGNVTMPEVLNGQVYDLSGQAISGLTNAFQRLIAFKQQDREVAIERFLELILHLTREYADPEQGWTAYGANQFGRYVEESVTPEDIGKSCRVQVKLDASLPKDEMATISMLVSLVKAEIISVETAQDQIQKLIGMAADTPTDETKRILRDKILREGNIAKLLATALGREALADLEAAGVFTAEDVAEAQAMLYQEEHPQPPPMAPGAPPPGAPPGMSPTGGLPPGVLPPTPDMVAAAGNIPGAMAMQGQPMLPPGVMPPGVPGGF